MTTKLYDTDKCSICCVSMIALMISQGEMDDKLQ